MHRTDDEEPIFIVKGKFPKWKILSMAIAIFVSCSYGYYYYEYVYMPKQEIPVISADTSTVRIKPEKAGGALMPNTDKLVYENLKPGKIETPVSLMPEPEEPVIITKDSEAENNDKIDDIIGNILAGSAKSPEEKDETPQTEETQATEEISEKPQQETKTLKIIPIEERQNSKRKATEKNHKEYYRIQLVSVRTREDATKEWERIKKLHTKQLSNSDHIIQKVNVDNKGIFYRLLVGKFQNRSAAKAACKKLSGMNHCVIVVH